MMDCRQCEHSGKITLGKIKCWKLHEEVEPFNGNYEYMAEECPCFKPKEVSE